MNKEAEMYNPQIVYSEKEEVTVVPGVILNKLIPLWKKIKLNIERFPKVNSKTAGPVGAYTAADLESMVSPP